jgi:CheY-like chemotaxis protein
MTWSIQIVMEAALRDLGVQVLTAGDGEEALELLERQTVDVVFHGLPLCPGSGD